MKKTKIVKSFSEVDLASIRLPCIALYRYPDDFPDMYVARVYSGDRPTDVAMVSDSVDLISDDVEKNTNLTFVLRGPEDVPALVGVWI